MPITPFEQRVRDFELREGSRSISLFKFGRIHHSARIKNEFVEKITQDIERAVDAIESFSGERLTRGFDVVFDPYQLIPLAYPDASPGFIVVSDRAFQIVNEASLNAEIVHELAHLALYTPKSLLVSEGWAVACAHSLSLSVTFPCPSQSGVAALHEFVAEHAAQEFTLENYLNGMPWERHLRGSNAPTEEHRIAYGRAGSFVAFLMATHGMPSFRRVVRVLSEADDIAEQQAFETVYAQSLSSLEAAWRAHWASAAKQKPHVERASHSRITMSSRWTLVTDAQIGGTSTAEVTPEPGGFLVRGTMGTKGPLQFVDMVQSIHEENRPFDATAFHGLRFEKKGDGKTYHICIATQTSMDPGREFMHMIGTRPEWDSYEVPFSRFHRISPGPPWTGKDLVMIRIRAFGYAGSPVMFGVRGVEFY